MHLYLYRISQSDVVPCTPLVCVGSNYSDGVGFPRSCQPWQRVPAGDALAVGSGLMVALGVRGER